MQRLGSPTCSNVQDSDMNVTDWPHSSTSFATRHSGLQTLAPMNRTTTRASLLLPRIAPAVTTMPSSSATDPPTLTCARSIHSHLRYHTCGRFTRRTWTRS